MGLVNQKGAERTEQRQKETEPSQVWSGHRDSVSVWMDTALGGHVVNPCEHLEYRQAYQRLEHDGSVLAAEAQIRAVLT